jgi:tRNA(fMet)-specific endonuclease VapC
MKQVLIDTDILSMFFRGNRNVVSHFDIYQEEHNKINFSIITHYEIISGLKHRDTKKQLSSFLEFASHNNIIPLTEKAVMISAEIYAKLRKRGMPIDDIDILIAGTVLAHNWVLVTHHNKHFDRIEGLEIKDWSENEVI